MRTNRQLTKAKSAKNERIAFIDYLRAIACFMVMAVHACEPFYLVLFAIWSVAYVAWAGGDLRQH